VEALVWDGAALGLRLERLAEAQARLGAAREWEARAAAVLAAAAASQLNEEVPIISCARCSPAVREAMLTSNVDRS